MRKPCAFVLRSCSEKFPILLNLILTVETHVKSIDDESKEASQSGHIGSIDVDREDSFVFPSESIIPDISMDEKSEVASIREVSVPPVAKPKADYTTDPCPLTRKWKQETNLYRSLLLKARRDEKMVPFVETKAPQGGQEYLDGYLSNELRSRKKVKLISDMYTQCIPLNPSVLPHNSYFLPELYPLGIPTSDTTVAPFHSFAQDFFGYEDEAS